MKIVGNRTTSQTPTRRGRKKPVQRALCLKKRGARKLTGRFTLKPSVARRLIRRPLSEPARRVKLWFIAPNATAVFAAGSFNNWNPEASPLKDVGGGRWSLRLQLKPGRYEYRFLVDGRWKHDPTARQLVTDFCGGVNSVLLVE